MKKSFFYFILSLLIITACEKEDLSVEQRGTDGYTTLNTDISELDNEATFSVAIIDVDNGSSAQYRLTNYEIPNRDIAPTPDQTINVGASGDFTTLNGRHINFWALSDSYGRVNGIGTSSGTVHLTMDSDCIRVNGKQAIVGGLINFVELNGGHEEIKAGKYLYYKEIDNNNAVQGTSDQYSRALLVLDRPICKYISTQYLIPAYYNQGVAVTWEERGMLDIMPGGDIKVSSDPLDS